MVSLTVCNQLVMSWIAVCSQNLAFYSPNANLLHANS